MIIIITYYCIPTYIAGLGIIIGGKTSLSVFWLAADGYVSLRSAAFQKRLPDPCYCCSYVYLAHTTDNRYFTYLCWKICLKSF